ncbi:alpha/beta fold hydrolase [Bosea sp. (in: a-proteobacteria)]|jgi:pimeloyl-ACP methyl ester carboxylesterase|uniref:alpha/beta fold hydrolase n=1 Tax=Bosea sp. (in: a-proteobacteria) TaxID=1871050 RepID=UPI003F718CE4
MDEGVAAPHALHAGARQCFYSGTEAHPVYVDRLPPSRPGRLPIVLVHGGGHTGACYLTTPDGRPGWAPFFAASGREVFVPDWPGHGRSPMRPDFATLSTVEIATSLQRLLEEIGPAILLVHSASGPMAWWIAERSPASVAAIIGIAPGAPANLLPELPDDADAVAKLKDDESLGCPVRVEEDEPLHIPPDFMRAYWANAERFPKDAFEAYRRSIVPESARLMNERFNIGGKGLRIEDPGSLARLPILIVTGDQDPRHPRAVDEATARYLGAEFAWLPERGIAGNGHMLMSETNSDEIAALIVAWLEAKGL